MFLSYESVAVARHVTHDDNHLIDVDFRGIHWSYSAGAVVFATLAGLVLSIIFVAARNLIAPIIVHATYDAFFLWEASPFFGESTAVLGRIPD